ncbi:hypothetical protein [Agarivorans gilvus]|uniref:STAS/SEC14 domain-containing protein n=1 Tax=Agarivorans gilvus TaxID=680279 RepID=A0ABQ1I5A2_9ALTE|nr:hypothetical protein [Agarivorans gilvus]GGB13637.1 hypothetical protein GCM10007414_28790 [Agarivorans gilvus]
MNTARLHGAYQLFRYNNILLASVQGSCNLELIKQFCQEFTQLGKPLVKPWAHLVMLEQWELTVPEAEQHITHLQQWCVERGMSHVAQVFSFSPLKQYQLERMLPDEQRYTKRVFKDVNLASQWLSEQGFSCAEKLCFVKHKPSMIQRHFEKVA